MDSHSRSASPREPSRPQHRPPSPPASQAGFDNRAYQHDDSDPNHNDSFASNGPHQNGHSKEPNGDTKTLEAVNLELINLTPKNGNAKKKDVEVDMNATNPYDEYFVPVNEHRKYMRGEKLYVTADKRGEKGGCKRPLCWTLLGLVVAAIVALIVLAATGILFSNSPTPLEPYNASVSSARALGGIGHVHSHDHDHDHDHDHFHDHADHDHADHDHADHDHVHDHGSNEQTTQMPTTQGSETQSDEGHRHSVMSEESGDMSMYVPKTVEGELRIDNKDFTAALQDPESEEYKEFSSSFSDALKRALFDRNTIDNGDNEITVEVVQIKSGSVIVTYRIHWNPRSNTEQNEDLLTANKLKSSLNQYLDRNNRMINVYHVADDMMDTRPVLDICQINNNDCEHGCEFDEFTLDFTCTCPHGQMQDMRSPKRCVPILENTQQQMDNNEKELNVQPITDEEKPDVQTIHMADDENKFDWKETHHATAESTTESDTDLNFSHIFGHPRSKSEEIEAETPKPEPEPTAEPKPEPEPTAEPKPEPEPTAEPKPEMTIEAKPEPTPEPSAEPTAEPEPSAETKTESPIIYAQKPQGELEPTAEPEPSAEPEPTSEPKPEPAPVTEFVSESSEKSQSSESELTPESTFETEPAPESKPEPTAEPNAEPEPTESNESKLEVITKPQPEPTTELKPEPEPTAEPQPEPEPTAEPQPEPEPTAEHKLETESKSHFNSEPETKPEPEPTAESNLDGETDDEVKPHPVFELISDKETTTSPTVENQDDFLPESDMKTTVKDNIISSDIKPTMESVPVEYQPTTEFILSRLESESRSKNQEISDVNNMEIKSETSTTRVSISEPNIINEPSYEPKPEIISIFGEDTKNKTQMMSDDDDDYLSAVNGEIADDNHNHKQDPLENTSEDHSSGTEVSKNLNSEGTGADQRSSKTLNEDFMTDTTTAKVDGNEDLTFELLSKNEHQSTETTTKANEENVMTPSTDSKLPEESVDKVETTTSTVLSSENNSQNESISAVDGRANDTNENTEKLLITPSTENTNVATEFSISKQEHSNEEKNLIGVLEKHNETDSALITTTETQMPGENDVTFDAINMLYNRSSKSIDDGSVQQVTESNDLSNDSTDTSDSDWLSETVTEVNYSDAMDKMQNHETTEASVSKIDEVINRSLNKDDFEPDYLSNMGSNNSKMSEQDEPLYGMTHDYDNDDLRVKRVNNELKEKNVTDSNKLMAENNSAINSNASIEVTTPTTVTQYIYKSADSSENNSSTAENTPLINSAEHPMTIDKESDNEEQATLMDSVTKVNITDDTVALHTTTVATTMISLEENHDSKSPEMQDEDLQNTTQANNLHVTIYEISNPNGNQSATTPNHTHPQSSEYEDHETEMNPFLPEAENNKVLVKKLQEGHDLEPINLNETQNENIEEHVTNTSEVATNNDISQVNNGLSEISNTTQSSKNMTELLSSAENPMTTTEESTLFNELLMGAKSQSNEDESRVTAEIINNSGMPSSVTEKTTTEMPKPVKPEEVIPISTFLLDTDDLDVPRRQSTESITNDNNLKTEAINTSMESRTPTSPKIASEDVDSENLSVVPIEPKKLEEKEALKTYNSDNIQELNSISDSPKKSDRRTLDATNLDSVINNEA